MAQAKDEVAPEIGGRSVLVRHPDRLLIPQARVRKLDRVNS